MNKDTRTAINTLKLAIKSINKHNILMTKSEEDNLKKNPSRNDRYGEWRFWEQGRRYGEDMAQDILRMKIKKLRLRSK